MLKKYSYFLPFCCIIFFGLGCNNPKKNTDEGIIIYRASFYHADSHTYINDQLSYPDCKIWYRDSTVIEQITGLHLSPIHFLNGKQAGEDKRWTEVLGYIYIDLPTRSFYEYKTLSDTATLVKKYTQLDSVLIPSCWKFFVSTARNMPDSIKPMADTTMENINFRRNMTVYFDTDSARTPFYFINYSRCDKKGTMFQLEKSLSEKLGCPLVRIDGLPNPRRPKPMQLEVQYITDKLTPEKNKIFDVWGKYAKAHPVAR